MRVEDLHREELLELDPEGGVIRFAGQRASPADQIVKLADERGVDLIAMSTHGHRFFADLTLGSTASKVRHKAAIPVLLLKATPDASGYWP